MPVFLIVVRGPIGVGKTSVSRAIRNEMAAHSSVIEADALKRMLDPEGSSEWRRNVAHNSAAFMVEELLKVPRTAIVEAHTKYAAELQRYADIATRREIPMVRILLTAPLEVCKQRAASRLVPGIAYSIDDAMVTDYYCNLEPSPEDLVFDTTLMNPHEIAESIVDRILEKPQYLIS